jgi:hypothetical protein
MNLIRSGVRGASRTTKKLRPLHGRLRTGSHAFLIALLCALLSAAGLAAPHPSLPPPERTLSSSPIELQWVQTPLGVPHVTLRNHGTRPVDVRMEEGTSAMGGGPGDLGWRQEGIHLPAGGSWSADLYLSWLDELSVRSPHGRLLANVHMGYNVIGSSRSRVLAASRQTDWQPFRGWRTILPAETPSRLQQRSLTWLRVIGDVRPEEMSPAQLDAARGHAQRGGTVTLCGGIDLARLRSWERAGLLSAPVQGTGTLAGLHSLARQYGVQELAAPIPIALLGPVTPPARVVLEEGGVPLVVDRPFGAGKLRLVTFDPTRPPFRGSALEEPFWQEWGYWGPGYLGDAGASMEQSSAHQRARRRLRMLPPLGALCLLWAGYLLMLFPAIRWTRWRFGTALALGVCGSVAALSIAPLLRGAQPVAAATGLIYLHSDDPRGWYRGQMDVMMPASGIATMRVPQGGFDLWGAPPLGQSSRRALARLKRSPAPRAGTDDWRLQLLPRRWTPQAGMFESPCRLRGPVTYDLELQGDALFAHVRNGTSQRLRDVTVIWPSHAQVRLSDLPPGGEQRVRLASVDADGLMHGGQDPLPALFQETTFGGGSLAAVNQPLLMAWGSDVRPDVLLNDQPLRLEGAAALLVAPTTIRLRGRFRLPAEVAMPWVRARGEGRAWEPAGRLEMPGGASLVWTVLEFPLPAGAAQARWDQLELLVAGASAAQSIQAFDWTRQQWVSLAALAGPAGEPRRTASPIPGSWPPNAQEVVDGCPLRPAAHFINPITNGVLVRAKVRPNARGIVTIKVRGHGEAAP